MIGKGKREEIESNEQNIDNVRNIRYDFSCRQTNLGFKDKKKKTNDSFDGSNDSIQLEKEDKEFVEQLYTSTPT